MFLDPNKLNQASPAEILEAASRGHLPLDHRFLHALLDRREDSLPAVRAAAERDRSNDTVDLAPDLLSILRHWKTPGSIPFLISYLKEDPENVPDELVETLVGLGRQALEPLLELYAELEEEQSGEVAFILANLHVRDERIMRLLVDRLEYDLLDTLLLLGIYGDVKTVPVLEAVERSLRAGDEAIRAEVKDTLETLRKEKPWTQDEEPPDFDIWSLYPETDELPMDLLDEDERTELLQHPSAEVRAAAAHSFFNSELAPDQRHKILALAQNDAEPTVRARAWESLINSTEELAVIEAMLAALRSADLPAAERSGLIVALAPEVDRNEVREAILQAYAAPESRAKALEAMWRSMHPTFQNYFAENLDSPDPEVQRGAIWGVGYYGLKGELERVRKFFSQEELRPDALFAYTLAMPAEVSRGRMKGLLTRIEKDARGLSEMEEELVKAALDERLMLAGKEPVFRQMED